MRISLDRNLSLFLFRCMPQRKNRACIPVLMYHNISDEPEHGPSYYRLNTSPERFAEQMQWLKDAGYAGTTLEKALRFEGPPAAAITFDDGYRSFRTAAWPILSRCGFKASVYLPTACMGSKRYLTWHEVRELNAQGVHFGSHTVTHSVLQRLPGSGIDTELRSSREAIENALGRQVSAFAYPYAFPQEDRAFLGILAERLRASGYDTCVTTIIGRVRPGDDPLRLKRLPVNSSDDRDLFLAKLQGGYDWMGCVQRGVRQLKRIYR